MLRDPLPTAGPLGPSVKQPSTSVPCLSPNLNPQAPPPPPFPPFRTPAPGEGIEPEFLRYSYYTAGSGGAGPTILETSFLLAGEECTVYKEGKAFKLPPVSNPRDVDFGPGARARAYAKARRRARVEARPACDGAGAAVFLARAASRHRPPRRLPHHI